MASTGGDSSSPSSILSAILYWFSPAVLFVLLNIVIGTIVLTSKSFHRSHDGERRNRQPSPLSRSSSVLNCLRSFNLYLDTSYAEAGGSEAKDHNIPPPLPRAPSSVLERLKSVNPYRYYTYGDDTPSEATSPGYGQVPVARVPSILERIKSINLSHYRYTSGDIPLDITAPAPLARAPSLLGRLRSINLNPYRYRSGDIPAETAEPQTSASPEEEEEGEVFETLDDAYRAAAGSQRHGRSQSDPQISPLGRRKEKKMNKSASEKKPSGDGEKREMAKAPPLTVRGKGKFDSGGGGGVAEDDAENGVDARADDFINRFRQQLKLQRLDSILRYKEMLNRGK